MARPTKKGLDYFPFDINFFDDDKVVFASKRFGVKGEIIAIRLLCRIYKNGYFTNWDNELAELFAARVGENVTAALVNDVVNELVKREFFNKIIFNRLGILTSKGIQERYLHACQQAKRKGFEIQKDIDCFGVIHEETPNKPPFIPEKENESKGNNTIGNEIKIGKEVFYKKGSEVLNEEYRSVLEQHLMGSLKNFTEDEILEKFDIEYPSYEFKDRNHLSNAVKGIGEKITKEKVAQKNGKQPTSPTESLSKF